MLCVVISSAVQPQTNMFFVVSWSLKGDDSSCTRGRVLSVSMTLTWTHSQKDGQH